VHVVELVGRDQVTDRSQRVDLFAQPFVGLGGGPQEECPAGEPDDTMRVGNGTEAPGKAILTIRPSTTQRSSPTRLRVFMGS
jgi:hypothetical protein